MKVFLGLILGIVIGAAGYWFIKERDADVRIEAKGGTDGERITISGEDVKAKAEELGQGLKEAASKAAEVTGDAAITAAVKTKLAADADLSARNIDVDTRDGVVTLNGRVASAPLADRALELAKAVPGVKDVASNLRVEP